MKKIYILGIIPIIIFVAIFIYLDSKDSKDSKNSTNESNANGSVSTSDNINYSLKISSFTEKANYKINNKFNVNLNFKKINDTKYNSFTINVNGNDIKTKDIIIYNNPDSIQFSVLGDYLIFPSSFNANLDKKTLYIVSKEGKIVKKIYELDLVKGMNIDSYKVTDKGITISGSRLGSGSTFNYNEEYNICDDSVYSLDTDISLTSDYYYSYSNNKINFKSKEKIKLTLEKFLNDQQYYC